MGTSDDNIKQLQLKESDWAYEWFDNDLFAAEQPQHTVSLPAFEIAQDPVTNAEYYTFIWDSGHRIPRAWIGYSFPDGAEEHPVVGVSKTDSDAYIQWLNEKTGMKFRLPTEAEWEHAARGEYGRIFPWGNTFDPWRCNTAESVKKGTTQVRAYSPGGDSTYGVADMVGNGGNGLNHYLCRIRTARTPTGRKLNPAGVMLCAGGPGTIRVNWRGVQSGRVSYRTISPPRSDFAWLILSVEAGQDHFLRVRPQAE